MALLDRDKARWLTTLGDDSRNEGANAARLCARELAHHRVAKLRGCEQRVAAHLSAGDDARNVIDRPLVRPLVQLDACVQQRLLAALAATAVGVDAGAVSSKLARKIVEGSHNTGNEVTNTLKFYTKFHRQRR